MQLAKTMMKKSISDSLTPVGICLAALIGLYFLTQAALTWFEPSRLMGQTDEFFMSNVQMPVEAASPANVTRDASFDAFHRVNIEAPPVEIDRTEIGDDAPETKLQLVLKGRNAAGDGAGSAILQLPDRSEKTFQTGDDVLNNVTLEAVYKTHVILSQRGQLERLTFERDNQNGGGLITNNLPPQQTPKRAVSASAPKAVNRAAVSSAQRYQDSGLTPQDIMRYLRPSPVMRDGQLQGFRLRSSNKALDLSGYGLRPNDIVTHVNGEDLRHSSNISTVLDGLRSNHSSLTITINRDGQILVLTSQ